MKTYYATRSLFNDIKNAETTEEEFTLIHERLHEMREAGESYTSEPRLAGGLDHVERFKNKIEYHDIGVSRGGEIIDNTFEIIPEATTATQVSIKKQNSAGHYNIVATLDNEEEVLIPCKDATIYDAYHTGSDEQKIQAEEDMKRLVEFYYSR